MLDTPSNFIINPWQENQRRTTRRSYIYGCKRQQRFGALWMKCPLAWTKRWNACFYMRFFVHNCHPNAWTQELLSLPAKNQTSATCRSVRANWTLLIQLHENKHSSRTGSSAICLKRNRVSFNNFQIKGGDIIVKNLRKEWRERESRGFLSLSF